MPTQKLAGRLTGGSFGGAALLSRQTSGRRCSAHGRLLGAINRLVSLVSTTPFITAPLSFSQLLAPRLEALIGIRQGETAPESAARPVGQIEHPLHHSVRFLRDHNLLAPPLHDRVQDTQQQLPMLHRTEMFRPLIGHSRSCRSINGQDRLLVISSDSAGLFRTLATGGRAPSRTPPTTRPQHRVAATRTLANALFRSHARTLQRNGTP